MQNTYVLDTSALLAWIQSEPGSDYVAKHLEAACLLSTVNLVELTTKLVDENHTNADKIGQNLRTLGVHIEPLNEQQAIAAAMLRKVTRAKGLSLGDRVCLALAIEKQAIVLTADAAWTTLELPVKVINVRAPANT